MEFLMVSLLIFILGICVGSFLNVVIDRLASGESILTTRSHCDRCGQVLRWYELIPLLSFIVQGGSCRECESKLSYQYPLVEFVTGALFVLSLQLSSGCISGAFSFLKCNTVAAQWEYRGMEWLSLLYFWFLFSALLVIFVYDLKHLVIPDQVILPASAVTFLLRVLESTEAGNYPKFAMGSLTTLWSSHLANFLIAAGVAGLFFLSLIFLTRGRGMGLGDVKLSFLVGLVLGWPKILVALYLAFVSGAFVGLLLIAFKRKKFGQVIPFGPFLVFATITTLLTGESVLHFF